MRLYPSLPMGFNDIHAVFTAKDKKVGLGRIYQSSYVFQVWTDFSLRYIIWAQIIFTLRGVLLLWFKSFYSWEAVRFSMSCTFVLMRFVNYMSKSFTREVQ